MREGEKDSYVEIRREGWREERKLSVCPLTKAESLQPTPSHGPHSLPQMTVLELRGDIQHLAGWQPGQTLKILCLGWGVGCGGGVVVCGGV